MVNENIRYIVRRPYDGCEENRNMILAVTDTLEEAKELVTRYEKEDEDDLGIKYDAPFYEIVFNVNGKVIRKGFC